MVTCLVSGLMIGEILECVDADIALGLRWIRTCITRRNLFSH